MAVYVLNTLITPINFDEYEEADIELVKLNLEEFCGLIKKAKEEGKLVSAIGHEGTAKLISNLCKTEIPAQRITVFFNPGDIGLHFFLKQRLPEGKVLSEEELKKLEFWLVKSIRKK